ncbi:phosphatidylserine/phosphatidylglycerophosphate/ cardiolipin synthase family protein [Paracoccus nototheniae]|uniref:Phospholipase D n=1 Tax=Paracoccus nototheniae TaxID=2489002 RepID=A0ABW4E0X9_9RHOB|nr:phospholipase D family protein [Paracoccus nototheniae]
MARVMALILLAVLTVILIGHVTFRPPSLQGRTTSHALAASADTVLGRFALSPPRDAAGGSGVVPLMSGPDAFAARMALIRAAQVSLDVQYYIWQRDAAGLILLDELRRAAERGVRVRLLLDDNGISGMDSDLAAIDALPNVELRLFNPFILRNPKPIGYLFDFFRLNRRMHNKSLTADGAITMLGGRNIGDLYFGMGGGMQYVDTDVMVAGRGAADVGADFDRYWASGSAHPADRILTVPRTGALDRLMADARQQAGSANGQAYGARLRQADIVTQIAAGQLAFEWTDVALVSDDPAKGLNKARQNDFLFPQLMQLVSRPDRSVDLVSAYFVPGTGFTEALTRIARSGTRVRILTNSQAATDVILVHSAYIKYRKRLLQAGVGLYELKPDFAVSSRDERQAGPSRASLHSKALSLDGQQVFIGSFNFDPRSFALNTEMGVLIDSPQLAGGFQAAFDTAFPTTTYRPAMTPGGDMVWDEPLADGTVARHLSEPGTSLASRMLMRFLGLLPIEWML